MLQHEHSASHQAPGAPASFRARLWWTCGNLLMLVGLIALLYTGGLYAIDAYGVYAARGDTDAPVVALPAVPDQSSEPAPFVAPVLNTARAASDEPGVHSAPPVASEHQSSVTRVLVPSIHLDSKVVEVGWDTEEQDGQPVAVWQVAKYAIGQHRGSANPGEGDNIVLSGHVGGFGVVFKLLYYVKPGDQVTLYSNGQQYLYTVQKRTLVTEDGVSDEQRAENAQLIMPTGHETVTMVTCWPPTGPNKFTERVVVQAVPFAGGAGAATTSQSSWSAR